MQTDENRPSSKASTKRARCPDCWRLQAQCLCHDLPQLANQVELVFLQHPLEQFHVKSTARLAALSLIKQQFLIGETFDLQEQKAILGNAKNVYVLYPALDDKVAVTCPERLNNQTEKWERETRIIILDGTWKKTRKMLFLNPWLAELPRVELSPQTVSQYAQTGLRKVKNTQSLSTLEAVQLLLSQLEQDSEKYHPLTKVMDVLIAQQQAFRKQEGN